MNVVDSSGWIEFFQAGPNGPVFRPIILDTPTLIVSTIAIYEVFKWIARQVGEKAATQFAGAMQQGWVVDIDPDLAIAAARLSRDFGLAMADSLILATARAHGATLWTQDEDFARIPDVRYIPKA